MSAWGGRFGGRFGGRWGSVEEVATLELTGFENTRAFGSLTLRQGLALSGFANTSAFGSPRLSLNLSLTGFANTQAFGAPALLATSILALTGFADEDKFGLPVLQIKKKSGTGGGGTPGGVGAAQKYATRITMAEAGVIVTLEAHSSVAKNVNTRMALYADIAGPLPGALLAQSAVKSSVVIGANGYDLLVPRFVPAGTSVWVSLHSDGNFNWFLSAGPTSRFNADAFADGPSDPFGASTLSNNKAPVFIVFLEPVTLQMQLTGLSDADAFGALTLVQPEEQSLALSGFANESSFGSLTLGPTSATLSLSGIADADAFGALTLQQTSATLSLSGFSDADAFGAMTLSQETFSTSRPVMVLESRLRRVRLLRNRNSRERDLSNPIGGMRRLLKRTRHRKREDA